MNYSEVEGSDEFRDRCLTSVKMKEPLCMVGPFLHREVNRSRALSEKRLLQIIPY